MIYLHQMDPIAFGLGPLKIHWYGVMYLLAFAACWFLGRIRIRQGRLPGVDEAAYGDLLFYCMLGVVLGGRIGYILFYDLSTYLAHPLDVLKVWQGGMSFHGGLLGVLFAAWLWSRRRRLGRDLPQCARTRRRHPDAVAGRLCSWRPQPVRAPSIALVRSRPRRPGD